MSFKFDNRTERGITMSATNKTTNYNLPIFIGSDVPSWLTDFNGAMQLIDTAIGNALSVANKADAGIQLTEASLNEVKAALEHALPIVEETGLKVSQLMANMQLVSSTVEELKVKTTELQGDVGVVYEGILSAGETTLTLGTPALTEESMLDVYTDKFGVAPTLVEPDVTAKTVRLTFAIQTDILNVKLKVGE